MTMKTQNTEPGHSADVAEQQPHNCRPGAKWVAIVDDRLIPMPEARVKIATLREQAAVPKDYALLRDHNSPNDVVMPDGEIGNLADGNVFYTKPICDVKPRSKCSDDAKLAYSVDDRLEIVLRPEQTGRTIRDLFKSPDEVELLRDFKSPDDKVIGDNDSADFREGPVFITKRAVRYCLNIEGKEYPWNEPTITTVQIRKLGNLPADQAVVCEDAEGHERTLREDEVIKLDPCCQFGRAPKYKRG